MLRLSKTSKLPRVFEPVTTFFAAAAALFSQAAAAYAGLSALAQIAVLTALQFAGQFIAGQLRGRGTPQELAPVNTRVTEPMRWMLAGVIRRGASPLFAEFDSSGYLWVVLVHCDSIMDSVVQYYLDDIPVTLAGNGDVNTLDFQLSEKGNIIDDTYTGTKISYYNITTTTHSHANPTPPAISALQAAFPTLWTSDHKLVGTTYSVLKCKPIEIEERHKVYKWRGTLGLGEPALSLAAKWGKVYDPRDVTQTLGDATTYKYSSNNVLIWAWFRTHPFGRNKSTNEVNWDKVAEQANKCDEIIVGISGSQPRYECATAIPEDKERSLAEQEILASCDAIMIFDDDGKAWVKVGYYETPTLTLSRSRDIVAMETIDSTNIENQKQGVIVRYLDVESGYQIQPSAPWYNPDLYVEGERASFLTVDIPTCPNHNQAMRLAKIIGKRSQSGTRIGPTIGLRGVRARSERFVNIIYDNTISGEYEIVSTVEIDSTGSYCGFAAVPMDDKRWILEAGEEKVKPVVSESTASVVIPSNPTISSLTYVNGRIEIVSSAQSNLSITNQYQYVATVDVSNDKWVDLSSNVDDVNFFTSVVLDNSVQYSIRHRAVTSGGSVSDWVVHGTTITATPATFTLGGTPITTGTVSTAYTGFTVTTTGGSSPFTFSDLYNRLPDGIVIDPSTGVVSGTPTNAATYSNILIRVQDGLGRTVDFGTFEIVIS